MAETPRASLRPYDDAFRCVSAPPTEAGQQRQGIDDLLRESADIRRPPPPPPVQTKARDDDFKLSLTWNDARDVGKTISRPHSTIGAPGLRGPTLLYDDDDGGGDDSQVSGTLKSLSQQISSMAINAGAHRSDESLVIRDVHQPASIETVAETVSRVAEQHRAAPPPSREQYWRSRQPSEAQYRASQEEYYQYRSQYYPRPGQVVDMLPPTRLAPVYPPHPQYAQQQQQPMLVQQQIYSLHQHIHKLSTDQYKKPPAVYAPAAAYFPYPPPLPADHPHHKKGRSRRGGARQRARENARAQLEAAQHLQHPRMVVVAPVPAVVPHAPGAPGGKGGGAVPIFSAAELRGRVAHLCRDQHGSRFLQAQLDELRDTPEKLVILEEVVPKTRELAADVFGNYVVQKVLTNGDADAVAGVADQLRGHAVALSLHVYGCRVVQKALDALPADRAVALVDEFKSNVVCCVHDQNGNHVIQKCVETTSKARKAAAARDTDPETTSSVGGKALAALGDRIDFILASFKGRARDLAMHAYGCRVLQRVLEHCSHAESTAILDELRDGELRQLIEDQYANYVVQHAIQYGRDQDRAILIAAVRANLVDFSRHKFASNVVEKCLDHGDAEQREQLIDEIAAPPADADRSTLRLLIVDNFANYVVQKVVELASDRQLDNIIQVLKPIVHHVKHTPGKHILGKIEKRCPHIAFNTTTAP